MQLEKLQDQKPECHLEWPYNVLRNHNYYYYSIRVSIGSSHVYLDFNSWIKLLCSRVMPSFAYLECYSIAAFSEESVAKLVHRVLLRTLLSS